MLSLVSRIFVLFFFIPQSPHDQAGSGSDSGARCGAARSARTGKLGKGKAWTPAAACDRQPTFDIAPGSGCLSEIKEMEAAGERFRSV